MAKYKVNVQDIESALTALGGFGKVGNIKDKVASDYCGGKVPENYRSEKSFRETIQRKIEDYCPQSSNFDSSKRSAKFKRTARGSYEIIKPLGSTLKNLEEINREFAKEVEKSLSELPSVRNKRLAVATKVPKKVQVLTEIFNRNPDVVAEVLRRAGSICEKCKSPAPFKRKKDGTPYLEVHHKKRLADGGEDTVENAIGICPNCHREFHFGV